VKRAGGFVVVALIVLGAGCATARATAVPVPEPTTRLAATVTGSASTSSPSAPAATLVATLAATRTQRVVGFEPIVGRPSLIDFYEEGCGPCVIMQGTVHELQVEYGDRVSFSSAEITDPDAAVMIKLYRARGAPFIVLLGKDGQVAHRIAGVVQASELRQWLDRLLK
jgi:thioredoxin 1